MSYHETRLHERRTQRITLIDGNLMENRRSVEAGSSARVREAGYWGFASCSGLVEAPALAGLRERAAGHARTLARFGPRDEAPLPGGAWRGAASAGNGSSGSATASGASTAGHTAGTIEALRALDAWRRQRYPGLRSLKLMAMDEHHAKHVRTSTGSDAEATIRRGMLYIVAAAENDQGEPIELTERLAVKGSLADLPLALEQLAPVVDELHGHLQAKRHAVPARAGASVVVMAPEMTGILAHEAMGHPCEADLVESGAVTAGLRGRPVASPLVTMIDVAHTFEGREVLMPVYMDDEGTPAVDAPLIERGVLTGYMHSRESAARMGLAPTGSARAFLPGDEPLIRMRNTVILPGSSTPAELIAGVEEGYWIVSTGNGQADSTTEFMFGVSLGYEIRNGRLGRAIRDTTVSGSALKVLADVDAVGNDLRWFSIGYCGKKQPMVVSEGGPSLRTRAQLGGQ